MSHLIGTGFVFGLPEHIKFDPNKPYTCCLLCGAVYQGALDLKVPPGHEPYNSIIAKLAQNVRASWAQDHAKLEHTVEEHVLLQRSGRAMMPLAAQRLSALGIIPLADMITDSEIADALAKASPIYDLEIQS